MLISKCKNTIIISLIIIIIIDRLPQANYLFPYLTGGLISYCLYSSYLYYYNKANKDQAWLIKIIHEQFNNISNKLGILWGLKTTTTLVLGLDGIGKKSLITNNYQPITTTTSQASISWWHNTNQLICLAAPRINNTQTAQYSSKLWEVINKKLRLLRFKTRSFDQILITLHIPALHQPHEAQQARDIDQINAALAIILKYNKHTPIKLIFTQADYIQGFKETFAQLDQEQIKSLWGLDLQQDYQLAFNQWLTQLNNDLFQHLFQNNQIDSKNKIINFPSQLSQLKQPIADLLAQLYLPEPSRLTNIFFCSSYQSNVEFDYLSNKLLQQTTTNTTHTPTFNYNLTTTITKQTNKINYRSFYLISLISIFALSLMTYIINNNTNSYSPSITNITNPWHKLANLQIAINNNKLSALINSTAYQQLQTEYQATTQSIINILNHKITQSLTTSNQQTIANTLAITEILSKKNPTKSSVNQVAAWLITGSQASLQPNKILIPITSNIIKSFQFSTSTQAAISTATTKFKQLPKNTQIALQAIAQHQAESNLAGTQYLVKNAFTLQMLDIISNQTIPHLCKTNACKILAKEFYYRAYIDYWYNLLQQPKVILQDVTSPELIQTCLTAIEDNLKAIYLVSSNIKVIAKMYQQWQTIITKTNQLILNPQSFTNQTLNDDRLNNNLTAKWHQQIQRQISQVLSAELQQTIQAQWTQEVTQKFANIQDLYPFQAQAKTAISLEQFTEFFGPKHIVDNFITKTIKPFIQFKHNQWQNKPNSLLKFNQNLLDQLTLYTWIQNAFFQDNKLLIRFNLIPTKIPSTIKQVEINLDQQLVKLFTGNEPAITSKWPFTHNQTTSIKIIDAANQSHLLGYNDTWGLFRLLTTAKISTTNSSKELYITLPISNYNLTYKLITETPTNPLILADSFALLKFDATIY